MSEAERALCVKTQSPLSLPALTSARNLAEKPNGAVAQLGERMTGSHEVRGSIPLGSTNICNKLRASIAGALYPLCAYSVPTSRDIFLPIEGSCKRNPPVFERSCVRLSPSFLQTPDSLDSRKALVASRIAHFVSENHFPSTHGDCHQNSLHAHLFIPKRAEHVRSPCPRNYSAYRASERCVCEPRTKDGAI